MSEQVLISTLGSEPQVVTLALDLLRVKGYHILIPVPVPRWSSVSPVLTGLALREDPWEAIQAQRSIKKQEEHLRKTEFVEHWLTPAEREVVRLACKGLDNTAIGRQLHKSEKTVEKQFTAIYAKLHEWRGFRENVPVRRPLLVYEFAPYFASLRSRLGVRGQEPAPYLIRG
jgi:CRISPR-associated protein Csx14